MQYHDSNTESFGNRKKKKLELTRKYQKKKKKPLKLEIFRTGNLDESLGRGKKSAARK